ncbi:MAG: hypothetical protein HYU71_09235 [Bacteroidetes bacterium]|nr:hypothetical protein [Bacteroidota bacterium]
MQIVLKATEAQKQVFLARGIPAGIDVLTPDELPAHSSVAAYFDLLFEEEGLAFANITDAPVFVNAMIATANQLPANCIRMNAWNSFLERDLLEMAVGKNNRFALQAEQLIQALGWKYQWVPDVPGLIAARVIAMIINEAYFGLGDEISSKKEIDIAMKLGTNYPFGPFEWSEKIGLGRIQALLSKLSETSNRYLAAPALTKEIT